MWIELSTRVMTFMYLGLCERDTCLCWKWNTSLYKHLYAFHKFLQLLHFSLAFVSSSGHRVLLHFHSCLYGYLFSLTNVKYGRYYIFRDKRGDSERWCEIVVVRETQKCVGPKSLGRDDNYSNEYLTYFSLCNFFNFSKFILNPFFLWTHPQSSYWKRYQERT